MVWIRTMSQPDSNSVPSGPKPENSPTTIVLWVIPGVACLARYAEI